MSKKSKLKKYNVDMTYTIACGAIVQVEATSKDEAREKAMEYAGKHIDFLDHVAGSDITDTDIVDDEPDYIA